MALAGTSVPQGHTYRGRRLVGTADQERSHRTTLTMGKLGGAV